MCFPRCCPTVCVLLLALLFAQHLAVAQQIPAQGTGATLDVATWNIEWFGSANGPSDDALQLANVKAVIEQADIDLWGVQEISDPDDFDALLDALGDGYDGVLATESGTQRVGFLYKTDVFSNVAPALHILTEFATGSGNAFAGRPPLLLEADVTLGDMTRRLTFIVLHMKCCGDQASYDRRAEAARRLKTNIDFLRPTAPIILLGDFNDELGFSIAGGQPSPYLNFVDDAARYAFLTLPLDQQNIGTFCNNATCSSGSTLDHILVTDELFSAYEPGSTARYEELVTSISSYAATTSDHLPVFARFRFDTNTSVETGDVPEALVVQPAYPNPFRERTTLTYTLPHAAHVHAAVFDLLGRRVATPADGMQPPGEHRLVFDAADVPAGLYLIRFASGPSVRIQGVVRVP